MNVIELEKGFVLNDNHLIKEQALEKGFKLAHEVEETDTYFTDKDKEFVRTRTCLRIRRIDSKYMELTYKAKSSQDTERYGKKEVNIQIKPTDYEDLVTVLQGLGFIKYVEFTKYRKVYSKKDDNIEYNIMLDKIKEIGDFAEFEIITHEDVSNSEREKRLADFIADFNMTNGVEKKKPYRDIAKEHFDKINI